MSPGLRSPTLRTAILPTAVSTAVYHSPDKSGLPSGVRGAGAVRFGLPSAVRGMPGVGCCTHCAASGVTSAVKTVAAAKIFIGPKPPCGNYTPKNCRMPWVPRWRQSAGPALLLLLSRNVLLGEQLEAHRLRAFIFDFEITRHRSRADVQGVRLAGPAIGQRPELD